MQKIAACFTDVFPNLGPLKNMMTCAWEDKTYWFLTKDLGKMTFYLPSVLSILFYTVHKYLYDTIYKNKKFIEFIESIKDDDMTIKPEPTYPIEYRKYPKGSQGMPWHQDTSLFTPDAFEVVLTITNSSDSKFLWQEGGKERSVNPQANTLAVVKPTSVLHSVSSVNYGERTILKFVIEFVKKGESDNKPKSTFKSEIDKCPF